ncbi:MAG TPA: hypothetical protein VGF79_16605 [Bacteroidia bacterium]
MFAIASLQVQAQSFDPAIYKVGTKYPGYIIRLNGDTSYGFVEADYRCSYSGLGSSNQSQCKFFLNESDRKPEGKYGPKEIKAYQIADMHYRSIEKTGMIKSTDFYLLVEDGHLSHYQSYMTNEGFSTMSKGSNETQEEFDKRRFKTLDYYHRPGISPFQYSELAVGGFAKKLSAALSDYPELSNKIKEKEEGYRLLQFYDIIKEYNTYFKTKED